MNTFKDLGKALDSFSRKRNLYVHIGNFTYNFLGTTASLKPTHGLLSHRLQLENCFGYIAHKCTYIHIPTAMFLFMESIMLRN